MNLEKSKIKYLLVLALVAITLPMAAWLASRPQLIQKQAACGVNLKLNPASGSHAKNVAFDVNLQIEAGTAAVAGADVNLSFDATKLKINTITLPGAINTEVIKTINNTNGTARISGVKMSAGGVTGTFNFATIAFEGLAVTSTPVAVTLGNAEVTATGEGAACTVGTKTNGAYTITSATTPTNTPIPTPTGTIVPTPTGTIVPTPTGGATKIVNLVVKLRGIDQPPTIAANQLLNFKVKLVNAVGTPWLFDVQGLAPVTGGNWTIVIASNTLPTETYYDIYIKGPMHLQKKFPNVHLSGENIQTVDLAAMGPRYDLEPGDLPISGANQDQQDGVVNSLDATYLTSCFETPDDATCLAKADLNLDGVISTIDMELLNGTVYSKWEDEVQ